MRRGGRLILLLGVLIAAFVALAVVFFLNRGGATPANQLGALPTEEPTRQVVVARIDIAANTLLTDTESFLTFEEIPESEFAANQKSFFVSPAELQNKLTVRPLAARERLRAEDVVEAGLSVQIPAAQEGQPRPKAIPFLVNNLSGVADEITPGDFVDVLASFDVNRVYLRPSFTPEGTITFLEEAFTGQATKTLLQNVQVLKIKRPAPVPETTGTPGADGGQAQAPPATDEDGQPVDGSGAATTGGGEFIQPGTWLLILAVTDQQAEVMKFSVEEGTSVTLVLRGRGDTAIETTTGSTLDLLVSQFGLPLPNPQPLAIQSDLALTPVAQTPSAVTPTTGALPTPTPTP